MAAFFVTGLQRAACCCRCTPYEVRNRLRRTSTHRQSLGLEAQQTRAAWTGYRRKWVSKGLYCDPSLYRAKEQVGNLKTKNRKTDQNGPSFSPYSISSPQ
jgi:hypothetical protein